MTGGGKEGSGTLARRTGHGGQGTGKRTLPLCWIKQWIGEDVAQAVCSPGAQVCHTVRLTAIHKHIHQESLALSRVRIVASQRPGMAIRGYVGLECQLLARQGEERCTRLVDHPGYTGAVPAVRRWDAGMPV